MSGGVNVGFNLSNIYLIDGTHGMDQLIITGASGKVGVITNQYLSGVFVCIGISVVF